MGRIVDITRRDRQDIAWQTIEYPYEFYLWLKLSDYPSISVCDDIEDFMLYLKGAFEAYQQSNGSLRPGDPDNEAF